VISDNSDAFDRQTNGRNCRHIDGLLYNYSNSIFWRKWHFYIIGIVYVCPPRWYEYFRGI